jgi:hypothetical protein
VALTQRQSRDRIKPIISGHAGKSPKTPNVGTTWSGLICKAAFTLWSVTYRYSQGLSVLPASAAPRLATSARWASVTAGRRNT